MEVAKVDAEEMGVKAEELSGCGRGKSGGGGGGGDESESGRGETNEERESGGYENGGG